MYDSDIPVNPAKLGKYILTEEDEEYIKSFAVNGVIPIEDYLKAMDYILNR